VHHTSEQCATFGAITLRSSVANPGFTANKTKQSSGNDWYDPPLQFPQDPFPVVRPRVRPPGPPLPASSGSGLLDPWFRPPPRSGLRLRSRAPDSWLLAPVSGLLRFRPVALWFRSPASRSGLRPPPVRARGPLVPVSGFPFRSSGSPVRPLPRGPAGRHALRSRPAARTQSLPEADRRSRGGLRS
jgi:hypothetical protein